MNNPEFGEGIQENVTSEPRISRLMGWIGLLALLAFVAGFGLLNGNQPSENASGISDAAWMNAHSTMRWAQIYVIAFALTLALLSSHNFVASFMTPRMDGKSGPIRCSLRASYLWLPISQAAE